MPNIRTDDRSEPVTVQLNGALNKGNSGGPVVTTDGKLVGVAVRTLREAVPRHMAGDLFRGRLSHVTLYQSRDLVGDGADDRQWIRRRRGGGAAAGGGPRKYVPVPAMPAGPGVAGRIGPDGRQLPALASRLPRNTVGQTDIFDLLTQAERMVGESVTEDVLTGGLVPGGPGARRHWPRPTGPAARSGSWTS